MSLTSGFLANILRFVQDDRPPKGRLDHVERELQQLTERIEILEAINRGELTTTGEPVPAKRNPSKAKLTPAQRRELNQELARRARLSKEVGRGKGKVSREAKALMRKKDRK